MQAGSILTNEKLEGFRDEMGDNISALNRNLAELTVSYWAWKNGIDSKYKGLCHYRRKFSLSSNDLYLMHAGCYDAIITTPRYVPGGIKDMFIAETPVNEYVMVAMMNCINQIYPDEAEAFTLFLNEEFYCPNNMERWSTSEISTFTVI